MKLQPTPVYDELWKFAVERQKVFLRRLAGRPAPWTKDPVLLASKFTNCYRVLDRVSQYLVHNVIEAGPQRPADLLFRILLFKVFNKIDTWEALEKEFGIITYNGFEMNKVDRFLSAKMAAREKIWANAYLMTSTHSVGYKAKHTGYLHVLLQEMGNGLLRKILDSADSFENVFNVLLNVKLIGNFLAYQYATDLNYSRLLDLKEDTFVTWGPGSRRGVMKCFGLTELTEKQFKEILQRMYDDQEQEFKKRRLVFPYIPGRRLQLIDLQNLMCETDKRSRVTHPTIRVGKVRPGHVPRIKSRFKPQMAAREVYFPAKWNVNVGRLMKMAKQVEEV